MAGLTKVHGGVKEFVSVAGSLQYIKVVSTGATYNDELGVVNSDLESVLRIIAQKGTIVIFDVENDTTIHFAMENAGTGWTNDADTVDGSLAKQLKDDTAATAVAVTVGSFRVA